MYTVTMDATASRREFQRACLMLLRIQVVLFALMLWTVSTWPAARWTLAPEQVDAAALAVAHR